ncbi:MAG TPA: ABC transporter permease [Armatimonadota bacterium]|nr:ABC transporter permease [Armatimonadota bacterium]
MTQPGLTPSSGPGLRVHRWLGLWGVYLVVALLLAIGRTLSADFLSADSLLQVVRDVSILGIVAVGVSLVTVSGHYVDLSIPAIMAVSGIVAVALLPAGLATALIAALAVGVLLGLINGTVIGYLRLNPIIWTLAALAVFDGTTRWAYGGKWVYVDKNTATGALFSQVYRGSVLGVVPVAVLLLAVSAGLSYVLLQHTVFGKRLALTGAAYDAARLTGVPVRRVVMLAFVWSGLMAAVAGILKTSLNMYGDVEIGATYDFQAITAVVLGGVALAGGRGTVAGVIGGVLAIGLLGRILPLMPGVGQDQQLAIRGMLFVIIVALSSYFMRKAGHRES